MTIHFSQLDSVKFINFFYEEATTNREKSLGWIMLEVNKKDNELKNVLIEIFSCIPILQLYRQDDSYLWQNRKEILEAVESLIERNLYNPCPLIDKFMD